MNQNPTLSICIPTYNRAGYLSKCLESICQQLDGVGSDVELIVSDNASPDETKQVVEKFIADGFAIKYFRNQSNMGTDVNFKNCILNANGKYVWLFGDDDLLRAKSLKKLLDLLKAGDYGAVYLNSSSFDSEDNIVFDADDNLKYAVYSDAIAYYTKVNYFTTFITGNIFNKSCLMDEELTNMKNTNLIYMVWVISSIFSGKDNLVVDTIIVAAKANNTGGYKIITTFVQNYNLVLNEFVKRGVDERIIPITNNSMLAGFFPQFLGKILYEKHSFEKEKGFTVMLAHYWSYYKFWRNIFPRYAKFFLKKSLKQV